MLVSDGKRSPHIDINIFVCWTQHDNIPGLSIRAITHNICYGWVCLIFLWCHGWNCLLLKEFIYKVTSLLWVWRTRLQVTQNLMTALHSKHCNRNLLTVWYLTCSLWSLMKYLVEYEKRNSISTSSHVLFCLLYKHTNDNFSDDFLKILQKLSEGVKIVSEHFPKISEEDQMMFWSCRNTSGYFSRDYVTTSGNGDPLTCYLHKWRYHVYMRKLTWYFTVVYIIINLFYYIKVSGIPSGNKLLKMIRYPHMRRYRWFHWYQVCLLNCS